MGVFNGSSQKQGDGWLLVEGGYLTLKMNFTQLSPVLLPTLKTAQPWIVAKSKLVGRAGKVTLPSIVRRSIAGSHGPLLTTYWAVGDEAATALRYCLDSQEEQK